MSLNDFIKELQEHNDVDDIDYVFDRKTIVEKSFFPFIGKPYDYIVQQQIKEKIKKEVPNCNIEIEGSMVTITTRSDTYIFDLLKFVWVQ